MKNKDQKNWKIRVGSFYGMVKIKNCYKPRADFCRNKNGNLIGSKEEIKIIWRGYFQELLNMSEEGDSETSST